MTEWIVETITEAGYLGIFLLMLVESIFPPIPSELIIPFAGFSAAAGTLNVFGVIAAAMFMWWPVMEPLPELARLVTPLRMVYLFAISIPMSVVSALITLSEDILYTWYSDADRIFSLTVLEDQQLGGLIMWVPGALIFWVAISILFYRWATAANREEEEARELLRRGQLSA